ncbi:hypothetical protein Pgy4_35503, partial [Pseudomonas savastanoi pv. glycinea str. race 4]
GAVWLRLIASELAFHRFRLTLAATEPAPVSMSNKRRFLDKNRALGAGMVGLGLPSPANLYIFQCPEKAYYHEFLHAQSVAKSV